MGIAVAKVPGPEPLLVDAMVRLPELKRPLWPLCTELQCGIVYSPPFIMSSLSGGWGGRERVGGERGWGEGEITIWPGYDM